MTQRLREQLAQEQKAPRDSERKDVLKQFTSPPTAGLPDAGYIDKIRAKIKTNIIPPSEIKGNPQVVFNIVQLPTGEVLSVRLVKTSGNALLDSAVERAILKSSPLPKPDRAEQWLREFNISFRPLEWKSRLADAMVIGPAQRLPDGKLEVRFRLLDVIKQSQIGGIAFTLTAAQTRLTAHKIADFIYEKMTGERGVFSTRIAYIVK